MGKTEKIISKVWNANYLGNRPDLYLHHSLLEIMGMNHQRLLFHLDPDRGFVVLDLEFDQGIRLDLYTYSKFQVRLHIGLLNQGIHHYLHLMLLGQNLVEEYIRTSIVV